MMLSLVVAAALAATPRPLPAAESGFYVPKLDQVGGVLSFMERAGERSVMLRPSTWFADFHPLLYLDFTRQDSLKAAGIKTGGSATVSFAEDGRMTCLELSDPETFEARARERLATLGTVWEGKLGAGPVVAAKSPSGAFVGGYARKGEVSCAVLSSKDAKALLTLASAAVGKPKLTGGWARLGGLRGSVFVVSTDGAAGLEGDARTLRVDGRIPSLRLPTLQRDGESPYAGLQPTGLLVARAAVRDDDVAGATASLASMVARVCSRCDRAAVSALTRELSAQLTGQVAVAVDSLNVRGRLSTDAQRFAAARQVWLGEVKDPAKAAAALKALEGERWPGATPIEGGYAMPLDAGEVRVGLKGRHLFLANDAQALAAVLAALPAAPSKLAHGAELVLDPQKTARALGRISLFDVMGSRELAGLFALSTELGPLLSVTQAVEGFADPEGKRGNRVGLVWTLQPPPAR